MPPHITEYFDLVDDKTLFVYTKNGDIVINPSMSTAIGRLYVYFNWDKYIKLGNSPSTIWNVMANIKNDADPIRFNKRGYQTSKPEMLDLDAPQFMGLMGETYSQSYWYSFMRIFFYIFLMVLIVYFVSFTVVDHIWNDLVTLSKKTPFTD